MEALTRGNHDERDPGRQAREAAKSRRKETLTPALSRRERENATPPLSPKS